MIKGIATVVSILGLYIFGLINTWFNSSNTLIGKGNSELTIVSETHVVKNKVNSVNGRQEQVLSEFTCNQVSYKVFYIDSFQIAETEMYTALKDSINNLYSKNDYKKKNTELEQAIIKRENLKVFNTYDTLILQLDNDSVSTIFTFDPKRDYDLGRRIIGYYKKENLILLEAVIEEDGCYYLINKQTGEQTRLFGKPIFSPNRKFILAFNGDLDSGLSTNGIQLFKVTENLNVQLLCYSKLSHLEPNKMMWEDNNTLIFKFREWDTKYNKFKSLYRKITFEIEE